MKKLRSPKLKTVRAAGSQTCRTRQDAAIELVRLEFDLSRLRRSIGVAESRCAADRQDYEDKERQRRTLLTILGS